MLTRTLAALAALTLAACLPNGTGAMQVELEQRTDPFAEEAQCDALLSGKFDKGMSAPVDWPVGLPLTVLSWGTDVRCDQRAATNPDACATDLEVKPEELNRGPFRITEFQRGETQLIRDQLQATARTRLLAQSPGDTVVELLVNGARMDSGRLRAHEVGAVGLQVGFAWSDRVDWLPEDAGQALALAPGAEPLLAVRGYGDGAHLCGHLPMSVGVEALDLRSLSAPGRWEANSVAALTAPAAGASGQLGFQIASAHRDLAVRGVGTGEITALTAEPLGSNLRLHAWANGVEVLGVPVEVENLTPALLALSNPDGTTSDSNRLVSTSPVVHLEVTLQVLVEDPRFRLSLPGSALAPVEVSVRFRP
jgi:hypothetical protein